MTGNLHPKRVFRPLIERILSPSKTGFLWFALANFILAFGSSGTKIGWDEAKRMYRVSSPVRDFYVVRSQRLRLYIDGLEKRLNGLAEAYFVDKVGSLENEIVVDIGANIGELSAYCEALGARVHAFEPDPTEFAALSENLSGKAFLHEVAVWSEVGKKELWFANVSGDTSLINSGRASHSREILVTTLDQWAQNYLAEDEEIRLLKLEAEGAEPEVLLGFRKNLRRCRFIAVDAQFERGFSQDPTLPEVSNFLFSQGFKMVAVAKGSLHALFERV